MHFLIRTVGLSLALLPLSSLLAINPAPKAIPQTRPEMKEAIDRLKTRQPRLPLPPLSLEEEEAARSSSLGVVNNARMRKLYLPAELQSGRSSMQRDPNMTLGDRFAVELFWIVSRVNNCHYCLGHQEVKLRALGATEEAMCALDFEWTQFTPGQQAAFAFAKKLTFAPHDLTDADFEPLEPHFSPLQILEIVFLVARYNSTNRWTDSLGIPQEEHRELNTQTASQFTNAQTVVGLPRMVQRRPLPDQQDVLREMRTACQRKPRLEPVSLVEAEALLKPSEIMPRVFEESMPLWVRLLCHFPESGLAFVNTYLRSVEFGRLSPKLKAEIAWLASRHDRALYALGCNTRRLYRLGYSLEQIFAISQLESQPANLKAAFSLVEKLTAAPQSVTDADIHAVRQHYSPEETAEIVFHTAQAAFFNRCTEAMNLPVEELP